MDNSTHNDEILVRYLDGDLHESEKSSLEQQLGNDKLLHAQYDSLLLTREAVRQFGLQARIAHIHQQMMEELQQPVKKISPVRKIYKLTAAIAAAILLLIAGYWVYNFYSLSGEKLYSAHYKPYELASYREINNAPTPAEKAFAAKDYDEVIRIHDAANDNSVTTEFLCGVAAMELKDNAKAIICFKEVLKNKDASKKATMHDEAEYYLSLSYLRNGDYNFSLDLLEKIKNDAEHTYHSEVTNKFIRQVRMLKWR